MDHANALDRIDLAILAELQKNARLPNKELAARVGIAQSTCIERVRRLWERKVLRGFHADVDHTALGIGLEALVAVKLTRHSKELVEAFRRHALSLPEVLAVTHLAGENDFLVHLAARDAVHLRDLAMSAFTTREEVARIETHLIFEHKRNPRLPVLVEAGE
jgi:DNA-binding Lrp family transcriptional regulator